MKPSTIFEGTIADMRKQGQTIDYELVERITRAVLRERSVEEERASRLVDGFKTKAEDPFFVGWPITEEDCPYTGLGTKCNRVCFYCHMKHVCMHCALKPRSAEPSADPLCPLRIPGCRCSTGAGPSIAEYYCNASDRFMGAYVQGARDEEFFRGEVENEEYFEETEGEDVIEDETEDDELLEESGNERLFGEIGGEEPLDDENEGEEIVDDEARRLYSPQSIWPLSTRIWKGLVPGSGWEQGLPPPSQTQVDYNDYSDFFSEPPMAGQHARGGRAQSCMDDSPLPIAYNLYSPFLLQSPKYTQLPTTASQCKPVGKISAPGIYAQYQINRNGYSPFFPEPPGLKNQDSKVASQNVPARKAPSSGKPATEESWPRASHEQSATQKHAAVGEAGSSQESATKKDSRGWKDHEKALVKVLMEEVISEGSHALTEERWRLISRRLSSRHSIDRTWTAVKNYWNRHGRSDTNIDERKVKKPDRMITGVQDPESRKARKVKRKEAESDNSNDLVNLDDDDDDSAPSSKRQRQ